ncbi:MGMT family protein [Micropruina sp.]|uniref:MGMT family protein n=1 Tax=Micropruina sp. TaxID=2737536 RepID=UPI0039E592BD
MRPIYRPPALHYGEPVDDYLVDRVLLAVEQIPLGRVAAYGDIARLVGTSPRRVGTIMRLYAHDVPWWRVVGSSGDPGGRLLDHCRPHWSDEGIAVKPNGLGCRMAHYRADQVALEHAYRKALDAVLAAASTPLPFIGRPAAEALASVGITSLERVIEHSEAELLALHGLGPKAIRRVADELDRLGWAWSLRRSTR